jgi:hypothetical protein
MSTYSAFHRVDDFSHPFDGRLGGYRQDIVPWVLWATDYGSKDLDTARLPPVAHGWGITHLMPGMVPLRQAEGEGPQT